MSPIFLDTDIILDVFAERQPFYTPAAQVLTLVETGQIRGCTSSLIFSNLYYVLHRLQDRERALTHLRKLHTFVEVLAVDAQSIAFALSSNFTDFEDAVQYHTAKQQHIAYLLTRNTKDYTAAEKGVIRVCTAEEYLRLWYATAATAHKGT